MFQQPRHVPASGSILETLEHRRALTYSTKKENCAVVNEPGGCRERTGLGNKSLTLEPKPYLSLSLPDGASILRSRPQEGMTLTIAL